MAVIPAVGVSLHAAAVVGSVPALAAVIVIVARATS